jgi:hypothetical protein
MTFLDLFVDAVSAAPIIAVKDRLQGSAFRNLTPGSAGKAVKLGDWRLQSTAEIPPTRRGFG